MKVFALIRDFPIKACDCSDTPPPAVRTFNFTRKFFVERPKFVQGVFQGLWVLDFLTRAKGQISVFHAEVCPNAFTCCWQRLEICIGRCDTKPIITASVSFDGESANSSMPLSVFMERIRNFIKLPLTRLRIPFTKRQRDTIVFQRPPRFSGVRDRLKLMTLLDFRSTPKFFEKPVISFMNTSQFLLDRLRRQSFPMRVCRPFQNFHVVTHALKTHIRQPVFIPLTLPLMKIDMHLPHIVKQIANADRIRLFPKRVFIRFHGLSQHHRFNPCSVGWQTHNQAIVLNMSATMILSLYNIFSLFVKFIFWYRARE